jgi:hypothetical protein
MHDRRSFTWIPWLLALVVSIGVGMMAYNAGMSHGLALNPNSAAAALAWRPWFHPFGFVFPFFFLFFWVFVAKALFWGGRWRHHGPTSGAWSDRLDQWHRDAHDRMNRPV